MGRAQHPWFLCLAAVWLLWACCHATVVMGQAPRRTADLRSGALELPPEPALPAAVPHAPPSGSQIIESDVVTTLRRGGVLMWPLLACSVVTLVFVLERAISLRRGNIVPRPFVTRFLLQLEDGQLTPADALKRCQENDSPIAQVFAAAVRKWGRSSVEVEQAMIDAGERVAAGLRRNLRVLNMIHTVGPLLGLLGTVLGIIRCFDKIASTKTMGRPDLLADGMSEALLTTAAGLCVAIPALLFYLYFASCADRRIIEIDALGQQVVQLISGDTPLAGTPRNKPAKKVA